MKSGHFDPEWYRVSYPDVDVTAMDPAVHYLRYGYRLNRDPGPSLSARFTRIAYKMRPEHEPIARLAWMQSKADGPVQPDPRWILKAASMVALAGDHARAIDLAEAYLPDHLAHTVHILQANAAIVRADENAWQGHVNSYLASYGVAPIRLDGSGTLFERLGTDPLPPVTGGPLISVIMPAWNAEKTVRKAAQSILDQTWRNVELLIVDDCSTDATWSVLQKLAQADDRVKILRNTVNVGPYVSKNIALTQARGEWITGHDADDWAHPERLERQLAFCAQGNLTACMSGMLRVAANGEFVRLNPIGGFVHDGACRSGFISLMLRAQYMRDILGGWDLVRTSGDSELLRRIEALQKSEVRKLDAVTMLCLDNPAGLTNDPIIGYREGDGVSKIRIAYKLAFEKWHSTIDFTNSRIDLEDIERRFEAPTEIVANSVDTAAVISGHQADTLRLKKDIQVDVVLVTNTRFPGGNASSSLDELHWIESRGLSYAIIHCPTNGTLGKKPSERYKPHWDHWYNWSEIGSIKATVAICRHPAAVTSRAFANLAPKIEATNAFFVKNNSSLRTDGSPVYQMADFFDAGRKINAKNVTFCPISPAMREEIERYCRDNESIIKVSKDDWTPTFDLSLYLQAPKATMKAPFCIGRHGRDGAEKWFEDENILRLIYPADSDFNISILGGAKRASQILRGLPDNWSVQEFGSLEPYEYLAQLDAFVYFPNSSLVEGFGRTIVEAMLAGVPVILPRKFKATFGNLPLYCEPSQVADLVRKLARDETARIKYLAEVQQIAIKRYSSGVISLRLSQTGLPGLNDADEEVEMELSAYSQAYRSELMTVEKILECI